jgi:hypothetical protein
MRESDMDSQWRPSPEDLARERYLDGLAIQIPIEMIRNRPLARRLCARQALDDFRLKLEKLHTAEMLGEGND